MLYTNIITNTMSTVDLYDVLQVDSDCSKKNIIKAYRELAKKYHPDKCKGKEDLFDLINHAFDILSDDVKRDNYDNLRTMSKKNNKQHYQKKAEFDNFISLQENSELSKTKEQAKIDFMESKKLLDEKSGFNQSQYEDEKKNKLSKENMKELIEDIQLSREQEDIELTQENFFEGKKFNLNKFNAIFEKAKEKESATNKNTSLINKPLEYNSYCNNYTPVDSDSTTPFCESNTNINNELYSAIDFSTPISKINITKEELANLPKSSCKDYKKNVSTKKYKNLLDDIIKNRDNETQELKNMKFNDFNKNINDGHMFLHTLGLSDTLQCDDDAEMQKKYQLLLKDREETTI